MTQMVEKESNSLSESLEWDEGQNVLTIVFADNMVEKFDRRLVSVTARQDRELYGWCTSFQRLGALQVKDFPTLQSRREEYKRRVRERKDWLYSGAGVWDMPKKAAGPKVTQADIIESIARAYPQHNAALAFEKKLRELEGDNAKTIAEFLAMKQIAKAWALIQAERRAAQVEVFSDGDEEMERLMQG